MAVPPLELVPRHRRAQIRIAAAEDLKGLDTTGANVHPGRRFRLDELVLPALLVYADGEASEPATMDYMGAGRDYDRELALTIQAIAAAPEVELDDLLDRIGREVEVRLYEAAKGLVPSQLTLVGIKDLILEESEITVEAEGARLLGSLAMSWTVRYATVEADPSVGA